MDDKNETKNTPQYGEPGWLSHRVNSGIKARGQRPIDETEVYRGLFSDGKYRPVVGDCPVTPRYDRDGYLSWSLINMSLLYRPGIKQASQDRVFDREPSYPTQVPRLVKLWEQPLNLSDFRKVPSPGDTRRPQEKLIKHLERLGLQIYRIP